MSRVRLRGACEEYIGYCLEMEQLSGCKVEADAASAVREASLVVLLLAEQKRGWA
jgi:hypothetical protein